MAQLFKYEIWISYSKSVKLKLTNLNVQIRRQDERAAEVSRERAEQASVQQELQPHQLRCPVRRTSSPEPERRSGGSWCQKSSRHSRGGAGNDRSEDSGTKTIKYFSLLLNPDFVELFKPFENMVLLIERIHTLDFDAWFEAHYELLITGHFWPLFLYLLLFQTVNRK